MNKLLTRLIGSILIIGALSQLLILPACAAPGAGDMGSGVFGGLVLLILLALGLGGMSMVWRGLFPRRVEWTGEIVRRIPWPSFFLGLGIALVILILVAVLGKGGEPGGKIAVLFFAVAIFLFGGAAIASIVEWLGEIVDPAAGGFRRAILGGSAWVLMICVPILGWALMAGLLLAGIGASLVAYLPAQAEPQPIQPPQPPQAPAPPQS